MWFPVVVTATWQAGVKELQFKANLGKVSERPYLKNKNK
jgi:hypothetical protein